jgi:hypothetical protein
MRNLLLLFIAILIMPSCKEKEGCADPISLNYDADAEKDDGSCQYGGTGGSTTLIIYPEHHGESIVGTSDYRDSVYIEFNAINFPGYDKSVYDLVRPGESGADHITVSGLRPGKYFIMTTGWDSTINERVSGAIPYTLTATAGEVELIVPVIE